VVESLKIDKEKLIMTRAQEAITVRELSELSGVAVSTINRIEKGYIDPNPTTVGKIAKALHVKVKDLV